MANAIWLKSTLYIVQWTFISLDINIFFGVSERVICNLTPTQKYFIYIMARTCYFSMRWWWGLPCTRPIVLAPWIDAVTLGHIIRIPSQSVYALSPQCCVLSGEVTNTIVFGLTQSGLEPTIYRTRVDNASHYTTVAVRFVFDKRKGFTKICSGMCPFLRGILVFTTYKTDMTLYIWYIVNWL
jgi:hypothetical protein